MKRDRAQKPLDEILGMKEDSRAGDEEPKEEDSPKGPGVVEEKAKGTAPERPKKVRRFPDEARSRAYEVRAEHRARVPGPRLLHEQLVGDDDLDVDPVNFTQDLREETLEASRALEETEAVLRKSSVHFLADSIETLSEGLRNGATPTRVTNLIAVLAHSMQGLFGQLDGMPPMDREMGMAGYNMPLMGNVPYRRMRRGTRLQDLNAGLVDTPFGGQRVLQGGIEDRALRRGEELAAVFNETLHLSDEEYKTVLANFKKTLYKSEEEEPKKEEVEEPKEGESS